jgi:tape measure domain-containing protein
MSSTIDEKIVAMNFKSSEFVKGVEETISALSKLKSGLNLKGAEKDLSDLDSAGKHFSLSGIGSSLEALSSKFKAMSIIGITALTNIANRAVNAGISLVKSFTIDPIKAGLDVYETKINAIQTILANTEAAGTTLKQVTAALNQLNVYANKTVYNFGQMAKNIGTFTAAGVSLKTSVSSIKGIANLAALSGSSAEQASGAMYQLSQAIATGSLKLQDWNSVVNAGLGGKTFQNALIETARVNGVQIDKILKKNHGFRNSLQQGWLSANILTQTLDKFTGDLSAKQLKTLGYTEKQTKAILKQGQAAVDSATKIRTITQLQSALREEVATAWSQVWEAIIGNIGTATSLLSQVHSTLENAFTNPLKGLAKLLEQWDKIGGRAVLIAAVTNAFKALGAILSPIAKAFRDVFPPETAEDLFKITQSIEQFTEKLKIGAQNSEDLRKTFDGLFSAVKIVFDVIKGLGSSLGQVFAAVDHGSGSFLGLTARIGDFLTNLRQSIESGNGLAKVFDFLGKVLAAPVKLLSLAATALGFLSDQASKALKAISPFVHQIVGEFGNLAGAIGDAIKNGDFSSVLTILNQALFGGVLLAVRNFISKFGKSLGGAGKKSILDTIKETFGGLQETLEAMQTNLKSGTLLKIAGAVALLTASVVALSLIDPAALGKSLAAITVMFTQLLAGMAVIEKVSTTAGIVKMGVVAAALNLLSTSVLILSAAVAILAQFSWQQLAKGVGSVAVLLGTLVSAVLLLSGDNKGLISASIAINAIAVAMNLLALAVGTLGKMDIKTLAKGVGTIAALLLVIAGFNKIDGGEKLIATAAAMVILGAALNIIAQAIKTLGALSVKTLAKGVVAIAGALVLIAVAMNLMPEDMFVTAAGLLIVSEAITILAKALESMGGMSWSEIAKGLVTLGAALVVIAAATILMTEALPGAAALLVVAGALAILTPVLIALGSMSWESIAKGLATLGGVFLVLGAAGLLLAPLVPVLLGLGLAITLLGVGVLAAGLGVAAFAVAFTALALAGSAAIGVLIGAIKSFGSIIPELATDVGQAIVALAGVIATGGPAIASAIAALLTALLDAIIRVVPKAAKAIGVVLDAILGIIPKYAPKIINKGLDLILGLLNAISSHIPKFVTAGVNIVVGLLNGIAKNVGKMATAGTNIIIAFINSIGAAELRITKAAANMIITLINGLAAEIRRDSPRLGAAGGNLASAIIQGMVTGIGAGIGSIISAVEGMAQSALDAAKKHLGINSPSKEFAKIGDSAPEGFALGVDRSSGLVEDSVKRVGKTAISILSDSLAGIGDLVNDNVNLQPTITPVIDLTQAKAGFNSLANMSKAQIIAASSSSSIASSISADNAAAANEITSAGNSGGTSLTFQQFNNSPKALSTAEIYRKTNNQLSVVKGALPK